MVKKGSPTMDHDIDKLTHYVASQTTDGKKTLDLHRNRNQTFLNAVGISTPFQLQPLWITSFNKL
jgi:hypothetical protein